MPDQPPITIVMIVSPGHSGSTWLGMMLGAHPDVVYIGEGKRTLQYDHANQTYRVRTHLGDGCKVASARAFWESFDRTRNGGQDFLIHLHNITRKSIIVMTGGRTLQSVYQHLVTDQQVSVRWLQLIRDGRITTASFYRKYPEVGYRDHARRWARNLQSIEQWLQQFPDQVCHVVHYEALVAELSRQLGQICTFLQIPYESRMESEWWQTPHPVLAGNAGTLSFGLDEYAPIIDPDHYRQQHPLRFTDERWKRELSPYQLVQFEILAGPLNRKYGYCQDLVSQLTNQRGRGIANFILHGLEKRRWCCRGMI